MLKINQLVAVFLLTLSVSCAQNEQVTTDTGLTYRYAQKGSGERPQDGNIMTMHIAYFDDKGNKIFSTVDRGDLAPMSYIDSIMTANGSLEECFSIIGEGDSIVAEVTAGNLFEKSFKQPLPDTLAAESLITVYIGVHDIYTPDEYQTYRAEQFQLAQAKEAAGAVEQLASDIAEIDGYLQIEGIEAQATEEGLRYIILEQGTGPTAQVGQTVLVNYTGRMLSGAMFDSSVEADAREGDVYDERRTYEPLDFTLGQGQVIEGWDLGIGLMNVGAKARIFIPSPLAYGSRQRSEVITANAILVFDVELVSISE